jgi:membrane protease YdiL (CAAX protease family)
MLSLLFGWTKKRAQSLYGSIVVHAINNLYSARP